MKNSNFIIIKICLLIITLHLCNFATLQLPVYAVSPTPKPTAKITAAPSPKVSITPTPTTSVDENVKEIRDAIKEKVNEIKDKVEKKAYIGIISQITDSTLTLNNDKGKQRVRLTEETIIVGTSKKEIKQNELAVDNKVIALGTVSENEILEAKRVIVVAIPKVLPPKRIVFFGSINEIDAKKSIYSLVNPYNLDLSLDIKIDSTAYLANGIDSKVLPKIKDLKQNLKVIIIYNTPVQGKTPIAKTIFLLP